MRTRLISIVVVILGSISLAQNWLPLKVGNEWQYVECWSSSIGSSTTYNYSLQSKLVNADTIISEHRYFKGIYSSIFSPEISLSRYDLVNMKIFVLCDIVENLHMNFNLPSDTTINQLLTNPYICWIEDEVTLFSSIDSFANKQLNIRSMSWFDPGWPDRAYTINYADGLGIFGEEVDWYSMGGYFSSISTHLIQCNLSGQNFSEDYSPEIIIQPDTTLSDSVLNLTFQVKHKYNHIFPEGSPNTSLNFIDSVLFYSFYLKQDTIFNSAIVAQWITGTENYQLSVPLDMNLLRNNYKLLYRIESIDKGLVPHKSYSPESGYYIAELDTTTDIKEEVTTPNRFYLYQNYPNPFNPSTKISWQSPVGSWQTLKIYDVLGNEVATLVNEYRNAGSYDLEFNASKLSSGVYYYKLRAGDFVETKKMILVK